MNIIDMNATALFQEIQADFNSAWSIKDRQGTIEFITPYSNLGGEFVSVFLTRRENGFVVSDGGKIHETSVEQEVDLNHRARIHYLDMLQKYDIKETTRGSDKHVFCYKVTQESKMLSAYIYDLARFQEMVSNAIFLETLFEIEEPPESRYFANRVKRLLNDKARAFSTDKQRYEPFRDEQLKFWKFTTGIRKIGTQKVWLGMTIHRSSMPVFERAVHSATFGFMYAVKKIPKENLYLSSIVDKLPEDIGQVRKVAFLQDAMDGWKSEYGATRFTYEEIDQMKGMDLLFPDPAA